MKKVSLFILLISFLLLSNGSKSYANHFSANTDTTLQSFSPFPFGAWVQKSRYDKNDGYTNRADLEFNSITIGTIKMINIRPTQDKFDFKDTDWWVLHSQTTGKRLHGHVIIQSSLPDWIKNFQGDSVAWEHLMKNHIQTIVSRYIGKINAWDVVNEAIGDDGKIKDNLWRQKLGDGYIERAFIYAHEANPDALLFYNDYGHEFNRARLNAFVTMLNDFKQRGIPVHGIGMQMHTQYTIQESRLKEAIETSAATGLKVHISELDVNVNSYREQDAVFTPELVERQRQIYKFIVETYCSLPDSVKYGITTWGIGDKDTWIRPTKGILDWPLLFDDNYQRKPAYYGVIEAFGALSQTQLIFNDAIPNTAKVWSYTFNSGDIIHFPIANNTGSLNPCNGRTNWIRLNSFTLDLKSTAVSSLMVYGKSGGTAARTIIKLETSSSLNGTYTDITSGAVITSNITGSSCGSISVKGLNVPQHQFLRVTFSTAADNQNVLVSEIELTSPSSSSSTTDIPINEEKSIKATEYYSLMGARINKYTKGLIIERIIFEDGSVKSRKFLNLK